MNDKPGARSWPEDPDSTAAALTPAVYDELRRLASRYVGERNWTVQATGLVHEAYARCAKQGAFRDRDHFVAVAATAMRQILIDHARARQTGRRAAGRRTYVETADLAVDRVDVLDIDDALCALASVDTRKAKVVELRVFGGLTIDETANALGVSHMTVSKDWRFARAWLAERLAP